MNSNSVRSTAISGSEKDTQILPQIVQALHSINPSVPRESINEKTLLIADLNIDSLKVAELSVLLEDTFNVPVFVPELLTQVDDPYHLSVGALVTLVREKLSES